MQMTDYYVCMYVCMYIYIQTYTNKPTNTHAVFLNGKIIVCVCEKKVCMK